MSETRPCRCRGAVGLRQAPAGAQRCPRGEGAMGWWRAWWRACMRIGVVGGRAFVGNAGLSVEIMCEMCRVEQLCAARPSMFKRARWCAVCAVVISNVSSGRFRFVSVDHNSELSDVRKRRSHKVALTRRAPAPAAAAPVVGHSRRTDEPLGASSPSSMPRTTPRQPTIIIETTHSKHSHARHLRERHTPRNYSGARGTDSSCS